MSGMQTKELVKLIDRTIVDIWENEIQADYNTESHGHNPDRTGSVQGVSELF